MNKRRSWWVLTGFLTLGLASTGCSDDGSPGTDGDTDTETGDQGDGDGGDGDGDSGDGDGDSGDGDGDSGDGDGDSGDGDGDSGDGDGDSGDGDGDGDGDLMGQDYAQPGPSGVSTSSGSMQATPNCDLQYGIFEPNEPATDTPLLLAHGFMRSIEDMAPTAEHIASWGVTVYTVPLCTNSFQINHELNGQAMAALGQALAPEGAVYAGFSAGGLAAIVAAANDPNAVAYVGLDSVDNAELGLGVAGSLDIPVRGSIAEPGQCNTNNNFLPVYDMIPGAPVIKIVGAQHFDFETDACGIGDLGCSFCAPAGPETRSLALGMTTAGAVLETGADPGGATWWEPGGEYFDMYVQQGKIMLIP